MELTGRVVGVRLVFGCSEPQQNLRAANKLSLPPADLFEGPDEIPTSFADLA